MVRVEQDALHDPTPQAVVRPDSSGDVHESHAVLHAAGSEHREQRDPHVLLVQVEDVHGRDVRLRVTRAGDHG